MRHGLSRWVALLVLLGTPALADVCAVGTGQVAKPCNCRTVTTHSDALGQLQSQAGAGGGGMVSKQVCDTCYDAENHNQCGFATMNDCAQWVSRLPANHIPVTCNDRGGNNRAAPPPPPPPDAAANAATV